MAVLLGLSLAREMAGAWVKGKCIERGLEQREGYPILWVRVAHGIECPMLSLAW